MLEALFKIPVVFQNDQPIPRGFPGPVEIGLKHFDLRSVFDDIR